MLAPRHGAITIRDTLTVKGHANVICAADPPDGFHDEGGVIGGCFGIHLLLLPIRIVPGEDGEVRGLRLGHDPLSPKRS